jgi:hypothetical protein
MDENINKELDSGTEGDVGANQQPSSGPEASPSAIDVDSLKVILEPLVQAEVERRTQSIKDKRIAKQESRISSLEDTLAELKALQSEGMSEKQAIQYMKMQELLANQGTGAREEAPPAQELAAQTPVAVGDYLSPLLRLVGIEANDADVIDIVRKERDPAKQMSAVALLAENRKRISQIPPNPAAVLPTGSGQAVEGESLESVTAQLNAELAKPIQDKNKIRDLGKRQKQLIPRR